MTVAILSVDIGTTYIKLITYEEPTLRQLKWTKVKTPTVTTTTDVPRPARTCELNPQTLWSQLETCLKEHISEAEGSIRAIGLSVVRNCVLLWNRKTGEPVSNIVLWNDNRCSSAAEVLDARVIWATLRYGALLLSPLSHQCASFAKLKSRSSMVGPKLYWVLANLSQSSSTDGDIVYSGVEGWLKWKLSDSGLCNMDETTASTTGLYNVYRRRWSRFLCKMYKIPRSLLPGVSKIGTRPIATSNVSEYPPVEACVGDSQAALIAEECTNVGDVLLIMGTAALATFTTGKPKRAPDGERLPQIGRRLVDAGDTSEDTSKPFYFVQRWYPYCSCIVEMAVTMKLINDYDQIDKCLMQSTRVLDPANGILFIHTPSGFKFERFGPNGVFVFEPEENADKSALLEAMLESIAFAVYRMVERDLVKEPVSKIRLCGGCVRINFLSQLIADMVCYVNEKIVVEKDEKQSSALGVAALVAWSNVEARPAILTALRQGISICRPREKHHQRAVIQRYFKWKSRQREVNEKTKSNRIQVERTGVSL